MKDKLDWESRLACWALIICWLALDVVWDWATDRWRASNWEANLGYTSQISLSVIWLFLWLLFNVLNIGWHFKISVEMSGNACGWHEIGYPISNFKMRLMSPKIRRISKISATLTPFQNLKWGNRFRVGHMNFLTFRPKFRNVRRHLEH